MARGLERTKIVHAFEHAHGAPEPLLLVSSRTASLFLALQRDVVANHLSRLGPHRQKVVRASFGVALPAAGLRLGAIADRLSGEAGEHEKEHGRDPFPPYAPDTALRGSLLFSSGVIHM